MQINYFWWIIVDCKFHELYFRRNMLDNKIVKFNWSGLFFWNNWAKSQNFGRYFYSHFFKLFLIIKKLKFIWMIEQLHNRKNKLILNINSRCLIEFIKEFFKSFNNELSIWNYKQWRNAFYLIESLLTMKNFAKINLRC